jgi:hypothetical protein
VSDTLIIPPGKKTGCLPRRSRVGEVCPLLADHINVIPRDEWAQYIGEVELSIYVRKIKDQNGVGSCATESTAQGVEIVRSFAGLPWVELNPWFIYATSSGGVDRGSNIDTNLEFVRQYGVAPESVWPRSRGWRTKPSADAYEAAKAFRIDEFYDVTSVALLHYNCANIPIVSS